MFNLKIKIMEKKIILLFLVVLASVQVNAQRLFDSFRDDFLTKMYSSCDAQMSNELKKLETPVEKFVYIEKDTSDVEAKLRHLVQEKQDKDRQLLCYESEDLYAFMSFDENISNIQFEFFYISPENEINNIRLLDNTGKFYKTIRTKTKQKYYFRHEWGFLEIRHNQLPLLDCYYEMSKGQNESKFLLIPFKGTNTMVWKKPSDTGYVLAF